MKIPIFYIFVHSKYIGIDDNDHIVLSRFVDGGNSHWRSTARKSKAEGAVEHEMTSQLTHVKLF